MKVPIYNSEGKAVGEQELSGKFFGVEPKADLVQQVVVAEHANARQVLAHTKTRGEVRGGGRKPWKQKGTGRARHGSIRSPLWRTGGVTFGPRKNQNFSQEINKKMKRKALLMAISDKATNGKLVVLDKFEVTGKTKDWHGAIAKLWPEVSPDRPRPSVLLAVSSISDAMKRTISNLPNVEVIRTDSLNLRAVMGHDFLVTTVHGVQALEEWLSKSLKS